MVLIDGGSRDHARREAGGRGEALLAWQLGNLPALPGIPYIKTTMCIPSGISNPQPEEIAAGTYLGMADMWR